ncbi:MAG: hypothetical protein K2H96_11555 [Muribaculaceae bacterium]|nr:hypothetical protein [Muribaculaceae bacterium]
MDTDRDIIIEKDFAERVKNYRVLLFEANVRNGETSDSLKSELNALAEEISVKYKVEDINKIPAIKATRTAYKVCGKDPNRYRPSQEQLMRRIVRGLGIYYVNNLVDAGNLFSLMTGCSVGCFDADKISGKVLTLGIGKEGEPYQGIGRGELNISGMPVFRDNTGGIGTPTSDNERTKLELDTKSLLVTVHLFNPEIKPEEIINLFDRIFSTYGNATNIRHKLYANP